MTTRQNRAYPTADCWWSPPLAAAAFEALTDQELGLLRLAGTDQKLTCEVLGRLWPRDRLLLPPQRMHALRAALHPRVILTGAGALWVHGAGAAPQVIVVASPLRSGHTPRTVTRRSRLPAIDVVEIAGRSCTTLERSVVDVARTAPARQAVEAVLWARARGTPRPALLAALERCRGSCAVGRPRARAIIRAVYRAPGPEAEQSRTEGTAQAGSETVSAAKTSSRTTAQTDATEGAQRHARAGARPGTGTSAGPGTGTSAGPGTGTSAGPGTETSAGPGTETGARTGTGTGAGTEARSGPRKEARRGATGTGPPSGQE